MASTFHGGIAFGLPICEGRQSGLLDQKPLRLTYTLDECALKEGDSVAGGDLLGSFERLPLRTSMSGRIGAIVADGKHLTVTVETDAKAVRSNSTSFGKRTGKTLAEATPDELLEEIASSGIVEQSGEALFDHLTRALAMDKPIRFAAVSCLDLDPLAMTNLSIVEERANEVAGGLIILLRLFKLKVGTVVCDSRSKTAVKAADDAAAGSSLIIVERVHNRYPQASCQLLTKCLTNMELSASKQPEDAGLFLTDAETCASLYRFFAEGLPVLTKRVSIYAGGKVTLCDLPYGLALSELTDLGLLPEVYEGDRLCRGGMDGTRLPERVDATLNAIALLPADSEGQARMPAPDEPSARGEGKTKLSAYLSLLSGDRNGCVLCGRCATVCPMFLLPYDYLPKSPLQKWLSGIPTDGKACIGCGCCSYVCPAGLKLRTAVLSSARKEDQNG